MFILKMIGRGFSALSINSNFQAIMDYFNGKVLKLDPEPGQDNAMKASLDMNSNDIINADSIYADNLEVGGVDFNEVLSDFSDSMDDKVQEASDYADAASSSAGSAASSANDATQKASDADNSAQEAAQSATDAQDAVDSLNLPIISPGDAGRTLRVKGDEAGYETGHILPTTGTVDGGRVVVASSSESNAFSLSVAATPNNTPSTIVSRDPAGRFSAEDPTSSTQVATKGYVDEEIANLPGSLIPVPSEGTAGQVVVVNGDEDGFEFSERAIRADGQTFTAGTGEDFDTLSEALDFLTRLLPPEGLSFTPVVLTVLPSALIAATTYLDGAHMPWLNIHIPDAGAGAVPIITCRHGTVLGEVSGGAGGRGLLLLQRSHCRLVTSGSATVGNLIWAEENSSADLVALTNTSHESAFVIQIKDSRVGELRFNDSRKNGVGSPAVWIEGNSYVGLSGTLTTLAGSQPVVRVSQGTVKLRNITLNHSGSGVGIELSDGAIVSSGDSVTSNVTKNTISANGILMCP